jgi:hypothetical protein
MEAAVNLEKYLPTHWRLWQEKSGSHDVQFPSCKDGGLAFAGFTDFSNL